MKFRSLKHLMGTALFILYRLALLFIICHNRLMMRPSTTHSALCKALIRTYPSLIRLEGALFQLVVNSILVKELLSLIFGLSLLVQPIVNALTRVLNILIHRFLEQSNDSWRKLGRLTINTNLKLMVLLIIVKRLVALISNQSRLNDKWRGSI